MDLNKNDIAEESLGEIFLPGSFHILLKHLSNGSIETQKNKLPDFNHIFAAWHC